MSTDDFGPWPYAYVITGVPLLIIFIGTQIFPLSLSSLHWTPIIAHRCAFVAICALTALLSAVIAADSNPVLATAAALFIVTAVIFLDTFHIAIRYSSAAVAVLTVPLIWRYRIIAVGAIAIAVVSAVGCTKISFNAFSFVFVAVVCCLHCESLVVYAERHSVDIAVLLANERENEDKTIIPNASTTSTSSSHHTHVDHAAGIDGGHNAAHFHHNLRWRLSSLLKRTMKQAMRMTGLLYLFQALILATYLVLVKYVYSGTVPESVSDDNVIFSSANENRAMQIVFTVAFTHVIITATQTLQKTPSFVRPYHLVVVNVITDCSLVLDVTSESNWTINYIIYFTALNIFYSTLIVFPSRALHDLTLKRRAKMPMNQFALLTPTQKPISAGHRHIPNDMSIQAILKRSRVPANTLIAAIIILYEMMFVTTIYSFHREQMNIVLSAGVIQLILFVNVIATRVITADYARLNARSLVSLLAALTSFILPAYYQWSTASDEATLTINQFLLLTGAVTAIYSVVLSAAEEYLMTVAAFVNSQSSSVDSVKLSKIRLSHAAAVMTFAIVGSAAYITRDVTNSTINLNFIYFLLIVIVAYSTSRILFPFIRFSKLRRSMELWIAIDIIAASVLYYILYTEQLNVMDNATFFYYSVPFIAVPSLILVIFAIAEYQRTHVINHFIIAVITWQIAAVIAVEILIYFYLNLIILSYSIGLTLIIAVICILLIHWIQSNYSWRRHRLMAICAFLCVIALLAIAIAEAYYISPPTSYYVIIGILFALAIFAAIVTVGAYRSLCAPYSHRHLSLSPMLFPIFSYNNTDKTLEKVNGWTAAPIAAIVLLSINFALISSVTSNNAIALNAVPFVLIIVYLFIRLTLHHFTLNQGDDTHNSWIIAQLNQSTFDKIHLKTRQSQIEHFQFSHHHIIEETLMRRIQDEDIPLQEYTQRFYQIKHEHQRQLCGSTTRHVHVLSDAAGRRLLGRDLHKEAVANFQVMEALYDISEQCNAVHYFHLIKLSATHLQHEIKLFEHFLQDIKADAKKSREEASPDEQEMLERMSMVTPYVTNDDIYGADGESSDGLGWGIAFVDVMQKRKRQYLTLHHHEQKRNESARNDEIAAHERRNAMAAERKGLHEQVIAEEFAKLNVIITQKDHERSNVQCAEDEANVREISHRSSRAQGKLSDDGAVVELVSTKEPSSELVFAESDGDTAVQSAPPPPPAKKSVLSAPRDSFSLDDDYELTAAEDATAAKAEEDKTDIKENEEDAAAAEVVVAAAEAVITDNIPEESQSDETNEIIEGNDATEEEKDNARCDHSTTNKVAAKTAPDLVQDEEVSGTKTDLTAAATPVAEDTALAVAAVASEEPVSVINALFYADVDVAKAAFAAITSDCARRKVLFEDAHFAAADQSIYIDGHRVSGKPSAVHSCPVDGWQRPKVISRALQAENSPEADSAADIKVSLTGTKTSFDLNDVVQGNIGTCYLLSAMGVCAQHSLLAEVLPAYDAESGVYVCRLFINGSFIFVVCDDRLPVQPNGLPAFSHCRSADAWWVALVEKAYAKWYGSYEVIEAGLIDQALTDLCSGVGQSIRLRESDGTLSESLDDVWALLNAAFNSGCLLGAASNTGTNDHEINGIVLGHAYMVTGVSPAAVDVRLVRLHNPWGHGEWTGEWSDTSELWTEHYRTALEYYNGAASDGVNSTAATEPSDDGTFWMSLDDFVAFYQNLYICRVLAFRLSLQGGWQGPSAAGAKTPLRCPQFTLTTTEDQSIYIELSQTAVIKGGNRQYAYIQFFLIAQDSLTDDNSSAQSDGSRRVTRLERPIIVGWANHGRMVNSRDVSSQCAISTGKYIVVCATSQANVQTDFTLSVHSEKTVEFYLIQDFDNE